MNNLACKITPIWVNLWAKKNLTFIIKNKFFLDFGKFWIKILKSKSRWQRSLEMAICWFHVIFRTKNWLFKGQTQICITRMTLKKSKNDFRDVWLCQIWSIRGSTCPVEPTFVLFMDWQGVLAVPGGNQSIRLPKLPFSTLKCQMRLNLIKLVKLESFWHFWGWINGHLPDSCPMGWLFWAKIHTLTCKN